MVPTHVAPADLATFFAVSATEFCKSLTDAAAFLSAANMLKRNADGTWHSGTSDGVGMVAALRAAGCQSEGKRALLIGAGGTGSAIVEFLLAD